MDSVCYNCSKLFSCSTSAGCAPQELLPVFETCKTLLTSFFKHWQLGYHCLECIVDGSGVQEILLPILIGL